MPLLGVPLLALAALGGLGWWLSGWLVERSLDRMLGDKLELVSEVVSRIADEQAAAAARLAAAWPAGPAPGEGADVVAVIRAGGAVELARSAIAAADAAALAQRGAAGERFTVARAGDRLFGVTNVPRPAPGERLVVARALTADVLARFSALSGSEMALFASWQRGAVSAFPVDLGICRNCHDDAWRVTRAAEWFHATRSFRGHAYFTTSVAGFRYAFMPLEIGRRRVAMAVVRLPLDLAAATRPRTLAIAGGVGALVLGFGLVVWWRVSANLTGRITALGRWVESVGRGGTQAGPGVTTHDEFGRLADSISTTVDVLRQSRDQLDGVNAKLQHMLTRQERRLGTFLELSSTAERVPDPEAVARQILKHVVAFLGVPWARMVFVDPVAPTELHCLDEGGRAPLALTDVELLAAARREQAPLRLAGGRTAALAVPLILRGHTFGALALAEPAEATGLADLAHQAALALEHSFLYQESQQAFLHATTVLVETLEQKDTYLHGHSDRVARMSVLTARALGMADADVRTLELLARFHDVGKLCVDLSILLKPGRLTAEEHEAVKRHVAVGETIVAQVMALRDRAFIVGQHHEHYDGRGYLRGLGGRDIAVEARIIAVCDAFDAMTSTRPYRDPLVVAAAAEEIGRQAGRQFDPAVAAAFIGTTVVAPTLSVA